jgi:hypothetical protein
MPEALLMFLTAFTCIYGNGYEGSGVREVQWYLTLFWETSWDTQSGLVTKMPTQYSVWCWYEILRNGKCRSIYHHRQAPEERFEAFRN